MGSQASLLPYGLSHGPWATSTEGDTRARRQVWEKPEFSPGN